MSFEERPQDISENVASLGYDLPRLVAEKKLFIDQVQIERGDNEESGSFDLEGLFVRLGYAIDAVGAKRVVLDTVENLFAGLSDATVVRSELRRLFTWLKEKDVTAIITGERGEGQLTRHGLEEYVSDCVVLLDNRVQNQITTRLLRVVKYRGSTHGTNEYPFLIDEKGISVLPITSAHLRHHTSSETVPTGILGLDDMLGALRERAVAALHPRDREHAQNLCRVPFGTLYPGGYRYLSAPGGLPAGANSGGSHPDQGSSPSVTPHHWRSLEHGEGARRPQPAAQDDHDG